MREAESPELIRYAEAARIIGIAPRTLRGWVRDGRVPHYRFGFRVVRFVREELIEFMERSKVTPKRTPWVTK